MPRFAANLSMLFTEVPFTDRFAMAARAGFEAVEFLFPYDHEPRLIRRLLDDNGLTQALFNLPPGDWERGERGLAALPGREQDFRDSLLRSIPYIEATAVGRVHVLAGIVAEPARRRARDVYLDNLRWAATQLATLGVDALIEPINQRDMPGYLLSRTDDAAGIVTAVDAPNLKLQFDIYHCQIMEGDVTTRLEKYLPITGHVQIAGVPHRHEPDTGELNFPWLMDRIDHCGYAGFVGCEYRPRAGTLAGLGWFAGENRDPFAER